MGDVYRETYFHFVWATKRREPMIIPVIETPLYDYIRHKCVELSVMVHALSGMEDHVHLTCTLPTRLSIAQFMHDIKGASAYFINHDPELNFPLCWQVGYGVMTLTSRDLPRVIAYIGNQKEHHRTGTTLGKLERVNTGEDEPARRG